ncbi:transglycosylase SLT domain-containing protein [uncultured Piscinibacter sp.]|uniref:transglycosylase SLT domain-containing protein n=1 Tax=uncultured Piscinibacter sp. TaxID=1131835 RepID=UPI00260EE3A2|nr:transglycosylase SLT domain-containing protein [uncultured Piscinibacter sp.]
MNRLRTSASTALLCLILAAVAGCATTPGGDAAATAPVEAPAAPPAPVQPPAEPEPAPAAAQEESPAPTPPAVDPLRPEVRLDLDDERSASLDLWTRVRDGFTLTDLDNHLVRDRERWYAARPDYVQRMTERGSRYLFHIVEEVERRGLPTELALLPFIESAFNPQALSSAKASGIWQFMPATGRHFELRQNVFRDDRRDVLASTRAALDYLERLHGMFGDWHLALAAYNWGEGNVQRAIARNRRAGKDTGYESLRMPAETRLYVPKLQAVKNIVARPADFGLELPELTNHPYFLAVSIERDIDVELAAELAELPLDEFKALNPQMNKPVILAAGTPQVLLPYDNANLFVRALPQHRGPLASWTAWVAPKTLKPAEAARLVGMHEDELREVNKIPPRMLVRAGSTLLVPRSPNRETDVSEHLAENATIALAPDGPGLRRLSLKAGKRDSVASVARRYRVKASQVAQWNGVSAGSRFRPGQSIVVYVSHKPAKAGAKKKTAKVSAPRKSAAAKPTRKAGGSASGKAPVRASRR